MEKLKLPALEVIWKNVRAFLGLLVFQFNRHQGPQNAAALTFTSLLSLVPLMTVSLAIFYALPVADRVQATVQGFLFENFVPTSSEVLEQYLNEFSAKASKLSGTGFGFLILVALMMMANIDKAFNMIWEVRNRRSPLSKFLIYWAVLSLGPILIGVSVVVTSYIISLPILSDAAATGIGRKLLGLTPIAASALAFTLMYAAIPNTRVRIKHAMAGGVVAAVLFEIAKRGFGFYITTFPTYEAIYGALATIPIFLVWVYLSWMVVLLGAEFTHTLRLFRWNGDNTPGEQPGLWDAMQVMLLLDEAAANGVSLRSADLVNRQHCWREPRLEGLLADMQELNLVHQTRSGSWALAQRLDELTLFDLYRRGGFALPAPEERGWPSDPAVAELFSSAHAGLEETMRVSLDRFRVQRAETVALRAAPAAPRE